jgi:hypothetical protein
MMIMKVPFGITVEQIEWVRQRVVPQLMSAGSNVGIYKDGLVDGNNRAIRVIDAKFDILIAEAKCTPSNN